MAQGPAPSGILLPMRIWDSPTRLFHWALAVLIVLSWASIELLNNMNLHMLSGYGVATLLLWRIIWGFVGSETSRFTQFIRSPIAAVRHLAHFGRREPDTVVGHNEAGGWMVVAMLLLIAVQVKSGMFANDEDSFTTGPLAKFISDANGAWALNIHRLNVKLLEIAALGHVLAVVLYLAVKKHNLIRPMITGKKRLPAATRQPRMASPVLAGGLFVACAGVVWAVVTKL